MFPVRCDESAIGLAVTVDVGRVLILDLFHLDPVPQHQGQQVVVGVAQEPANGGLAGFQQQRDPGAAALSVEAVHAPGLQVDQVQDLLAGGQGDQRQGIGRPYLAYGEIEVGVGQRANQPHRARRVEQQIQAVRGR